MTNLETLRKIFDDLAEDHREEGESLEDAFRNKKGDITKALDDVAEDHRQLGEELENLRKELVKVTAERDEAVGSFMKGDNNDKEDDGIYGDIE